MLWSTSLLPRAEQEDGEAAVMERLPFGVGVLIKG